MVGSTKLREKYEKQKFLRENAAILKGFVQTLFINNLRRMYPMCCVFRVGFVYFDVA
jgi:hypothetical protein